MKKVILVILLSIFSSAVFATKIALTTASTLNVRGEPQGKVTFSLPKNSVVVVMRVQGSWARVLFAPDNDPTKAKYGWVSTSHLEVVNSGYGTSGGDCEYEYESNSKICVTTTDVEIDCLESYDNTHYRSCETKVEYNVSSDYEGDDYIDVDVECDVEIKYKKNDDYSWNYSSDSESENHTLYSYGEQSGDMDIDFYVSSFKEVTDVEVNSVECEINSVLKY